MTERHRHDSPQSRERFISAGWELIDEVGLLDALRSITVADVAARAGRSERTFWNHFADWNSFVEVLVSNIPRRGPMVDDGEYTAVDVVDEALVAATREALPELARAAAEGNWVEVTQPEELTAFRRQLLLTSRATEENSLREVLGRDYYGAFLPRLQRIYEQTAAAAKVQPLEPLDFEQFTRVLAALSEGLLLQHLADPSQVSTDFVVDATAAVGMTLLAPEELHRGLGDLAAELAVSPGPVDAGPETLELGHRCRELVTTHGRLAHWRDVAVACRADETELRRRVQRLSILGALCFGDNLPLEVARDTPHDWLCQLVRVARRDPWCAHCNLTERLSEAPDSATIRSLVPLGAEFAAVVGERPASVHERVVNVALAGALSDTASAPADTAHAAIAVHPTLRDSGLGTLV